MLDFVLDFFKEYRYLQLADLREIYRISSFETYKAGELIARDRQVFEYAVGIRKGIIRTYLLDSNGDEKTVRLSKKGEFTTCYKSLLFSQPSNEYLEAVEETKVILISAIRFRELMNDNIRLLKLWNNGLSVALENAIQRIEFYTTLSPEERYRHILKESPELIQRIPQKYLASYIGITTVSLSRIKSRVSPRTD
ncbi:MAG: Crp/Fnr family transcriptional regulator [Bacteroidetes bacterium]|nr:Crp/Fnr family transcriptional regulator [Bacteroidota bacterium]